MIKIKIKNAEEIVEREKSWLISKVAPYFVDVESRVEQAIVAQLIEVFQAKNIIAEISVSKES